MVNMGTAKSTAYDFLHTSISFLESLSMGTRGKPRVFHLVGRMIKNWEYHNLYMDFSSMFDGNDHPSDIDMFYLCKDRTLILGEIKSNRGTFNDGQRWLLQRILEQHRGDGIGLYITHDKLVQNGDTTVDVSICPVNEIFIKSEGVWRKTKKPVTVKGILEYYKERARWRIERQY